MALAKCFKIAAKRKSTTIIPMVLLFIISIIILVLSIQQLSAYIPDYVDPDGQRPFQDFEEDICDNVLFGFLSPFLLNVKTTLECDETDSLYLLCQVNEGTEDFGLIGCPWRERNTIFRLVIDSITIISTIIIFILDCDGLYSGYNSCLNEFDLDGDDDENDKLLWFDVDNSGSWGSYTTTIDCKLNPFIYTCLADLAAVIFGFCVWRISMFYKFNNNDISEPTSSDKPTVAEMGALSTTNQSGSIVSPPTGSTTTTMTATPNPPPTTTTTSNTITAGQINKKEDSPDPFEDILNTNNNQGTTGGVPEDYVNPFDD